MKIFACNQLIAYSNVHFVEKLKLPFLVQKILNPISLFFRHHPNLFSLPPSLQSNLIELLSNKSLIYDQCTVI
jgi:hypothetical protein